MKHTRTLINVIAFILLAGTYSNAMPVTNPEQGVGIVANYRPAAGRFNFSRTPGNETIPVRIGTVVNAGDKITLPAGATVIVNLADETVRNFDGPGTLTVPDARPLGKIASFFLSIPALFDNQYRLSGTAASRGAGDCGDAGSEHDSPINIPMLASGANITAGVRDLPLAWQGGCAPYNVSVVSGKQVIARRAGVAGQMTRLDKVALPVGRYTVTITDAANKRFETTLEARQRGPAMPTDLTGDQTPLGVIAQAVWLAEQDQGRWRLDSFEQLRPLIRAGNPLAGAVGDGLLWSRRNQ